MTNAHAAEQASTSLGSDLSSHIRIDRLRRPSRDLAEKLDVLLRQLSSNAPSVTRERLEAIVGTPGVMLLIAYDDRQPAGMLTLTLLPLLAGKRARIEDVVVAETHRRMGIGEKLVNEAITHAVAAGARTIDLSARPEHPAAIRLYTRLGFQQRRSHLYRLEPDAGPVSSTKT